MFIKERESTEEGYIDILSAESEIYEEDIESGDIKQLSYFGSNYNYALSLG